MQWEVRRTTGPKTPAVPGQAGTGYLARADVEVTVDIPTGGSTPSGAVRYNVVPEVYEVKRYTGPGSIVAAQRQATRTVRTLNASAHVNNFAVGTILAGWTKRYVFDGEDYVAWAPAATPGVVMFKPLGDDDPPSDPLAPPTDNGLGDEVGDAAGAGAAGAAGGALGGAGKGGSGGEVPTPVPRPQPVPVPAVGGSMSQLFAGLEGG